MTSEEMTKTAEGLSDAEFSDAVDAMILDIEKDLANATKLRRDLGLVELQLKCQPEDNQKERALLLQRKAKLEAKLTIALDEYWKTMI